MSYGSRRCFATFLEQDGPPDAKTGDAGEQFRMSERQRVRGTAVDSYFCESRGNRVAKTWRLPQHKNLLYGLFQAAAAALMQPAEKAHIIH